MWGHKIRLRELLFEFITKRGFSLFEMTLFWNAKVCFTNLQHTRKKYKCSACAQMGFKCNWCSQPQLKCAFKHNTAEVWRLKHRSSWYSSAVSFTSEALLILNPRHNCPLFLKFWLIRRVEVGLWKITNVYVLRMVMLIMYAGLLGRHTGSLMLVIRIKW